MSELEVYEAPEQSVTLFRTGEAAEVADKLHTMLTEGVPF